MPLPIEFTALPARLPGLALMTVSAYLMGIGIGVYNVHLDRVAPAPREITGTAWWFAITRPVNPAPPAPAAARIAVRHKRRCRA